ncbi:MAG: efflux transporter periplasmic adaptor subunit [Sphingobacteriales bacterium SCN 48-20]|jgi:RND family efflux transporter MFP subunit|uniref:efflux RND transporter periplasmic adaptor subunit n=1 Tax=Terrimonas ferruginea TaxID=249 RepID=UPI00086D00F4|nr:efflux RND transporter periplasmic adaptor subunit [Terrimonas ferruginea]MBN8785130.1 efflux RND transporter periplasmic adaptor subunit [Terrimonas ferruginea]ODT90481.1 MAG: efflux transporter periplasmic adaptor subunit [Sphingobacteriales bacterium SCN 48-20]OJW41543.1 MAG: efflux transporter periplasmic adaptor subunit [Sphingobacteriales bacterium 48-107]
MHKTTSAILVALMSTFLLSCGNDKKTEPIQDDIIPVRIMPLQQDSLRQEVNTSGQFTTDDETILSFKNGGIISRIFVKEGDAVSRGQILATLNPTEINAMAEQASLALQKAQRDYERAQNLYRDSVATLEQLQNAKTAYDVARQQNSSAGFNRIYTEIRSVSSGYVLRKFSNEGQVVGPGTPVLQINGATQGKWLLRTGVSDIQWAMIKTGDKALVSTDALPGQQFPAIVSKKSEGIDPMSGTFNVEIEITGKAPAGLAAGLFGKAVIYPTRITNAWPIPYDALLDGNGNEGYVFVTDDNKTARKVKVQIARVENNQVLISSGLENARSLIISGSAYLNDGSKIKIN